MQLQAMSVGDESRVHGRIGYKYRSQLPLSSISSATANLAMAASILWLVLFGTFAVSLEAALELPPSFQRCQLKDANLNKCLDGAIQTAIHVLKSGVPALKIDPIDPYHVNSIAINGGGVQSVKLNLVLSNITISGLGDSQVVEGTSNLDLEKFTLKFSTLTPLLRNDFTHIIDGKVLLVAIRGQGPGKAITDDLTTDHTIKFSPMEKDGKTYWHVDDYTISFKPRALKVDYYGLFPENKKLGEEMRKFLSDNSLLLFQELGDYVEKGFAAAYKNVASRVFNEIPIDDIF